MFLASISQVIECPDKVWLEAKRLLVSGYGWLEFPLLLEGVSQVKMCLQKVRFEMQRVQIAGHGFVEFSLLPKGVRQFMGARRRGLV